MSEPIQLSITTETVRTLRSTQTLYHRTLRMADGVSPVRCRVNGKVRTWKTRHTKFVVPVKHGLRDCFYIDETNAHEWSLSEEEAKGSSSE
jgi:hypothetical protein